MKKSIEQIKAEYMGMSIYERILKKQVVLDNAETLDEHHTLTTAIFNWNNEIKDRAEAEKQGITYEQYKENEKKATAEWHKAEKEKREKMEKETWGFFSAEQVKLAKQLAYTLARAYGKSDRAEAEMVKSIHKANSVKDVCELFNGKTADNLYNAVKNNKQTIDWE